MNATDAAEGVEVTHPKYGRGVITEHDTRAGDEADKITVNFHDVDIQKTIPVFAVEPAKSVTTANITDGRYGFNAVVDEDYCTVEVSPNGDGTGYDVVLSIDGEQVDTASLSWK